MRRFTRRLRRQRSRVQAAAALTASAVLLAAPGAGATPPKASRPETDNSFYLPCGDPPPSQSQCDSMSGHYTGPDITSYPTNPSAYTHVSTGDRSCALTWSSWYQINANVTTTSFSFQQNVNPVGANMSRFRVCYGNYQGSIVVDFVDFGQLQYGADISNPSAPGANSFFTQWETHMQYSNGTNTTPDAVAWQGDDLSFWDTPSNPTLMEYFSLKPPNQQFGSTSATVWVYNCPWYNPTQISGDQFMGLYHNTCGWAGQQISLK
jgi:hypothetical protein